MRLVLQIFLVLIAAGAIAWIAIKLIELVVSRRSRQKAIDESEFDLPAMPFWVPLLVIASTAVGVYIAVNLLSH